MWAAQQCLMLFQQTLTILMLHNHDQEKGRQNQSGCINKVALRWSGLHCNAFACQWDICNEFNLFLFIENKSKVRLGEKWHEQEQDELQQHLQQQQLLQHSDQQQAEQLVQQQQRQQPHQEQLQEQQLAKQQGQGHKKQQQQQEPQQLQLEQPKQNRQLHEHVSLTCMSSNPFICRLTGRTEIRVAHTEQNSNWSKSICPSIKSSTPVSFDRSQSKVLCNSGLIDGHIDFDQYEFCVVWATCISFLVLFIVPPFLNPFPSLNIILFFYRKGSFLHLWRRHCRCWTFNVWHVFSAWLPNSSGLCLRKGVMAAKENRRAPLTLGDESENLFLEKDKFFALPKKSLTFAKLSNKVINLVPLY